MPWLGLVRCRDRFHLHRRNHCRRIRNSLSRRIYFEGSKIFRDGGHGQWWIEMVPVRLEIFHHYWVEVQCHLRVLLHYLLDGHDDYLVCDGLSYYVGLRVWHDIDHRGGQVMSMPRERLIWIRCGC